MLEKLVLASIITFALNLFLGGHIAGSNQLSNQSQLMITPDQPEYTLTAQVAPRK